MVKTIIKNMTVFTLLIGTYHVVHAQNEIKTYTNQEGQTIRVVSSNKFHKTKPLMELINQSVKKNTSEEIKEHKNRMRHNEIVNHNALPLGNDPIQQTKNGTITAKSPIINFDGLPMNGGIPLDPSGAAGPNHYVQAINASLKIWDKSGNAIGTAANLSTLWPGSTDDGDPIVMYDKHADRWFISQFQSSPPFKLLVAVSQTNDPTGSYYSYSFNVNDLPDYPKYSVWSDGYYFSINSSDGTSGVMDRTKMLAGDMTATMQIVDAPNHATNGFTSLLPADADGDLPPAGSPCYFFNLVDDAWGIEADGIKVYKMTTDFDTPSNTAIVEETKINTSAFNTSFPTGADPYAYQHISQKGTSYKLDAVAEVFYYRAQHRVWTNHNSIVLCHVVDVDNNDRAGIRWYELRQTNGTGPWSLYQEGTYAPNTDTDNRWMASISMDNAGNIALAYSASGPDTYPSIRYTGRMSNDPLGQMTITEQTAHAGEGSQEVNEAGDRYGDYSHLCLDPDGTTFWHTAQYVQSNGYPATRIYSFSINGTNATENNPYSSIETSFLQTQSELLVSVKGLPTNKPIQVDVFDVNGKIIIKNLTSPSNFEAICKIDLGGMNTGTYLIRLGNETFQKVEKYSIVKQ